MSQNWSDWEVATKTLTPQERVKSLGYLIESEATQNGNFTPADIVKQMPPDKRKDLAVASLKELPKEDVKSVIAGLSLPEPEAGTNNILWMIFLISSAIIFLASGIALVSGMFVPAESKSYFVKPEVIFTVWSTITAYLVGLFSPRPKKDG